MAKVSRIAALSLASMLLLTLPYPADGQAGRTPNSVALCLPPGGNPAPCGTARPGQTIRLRIATTNMPTGPIHLLFAEEAAAGQAPRVARLILPPSRSIDGGYEVNVPPALCAGRGRAAGNFQIQHLMSEYNQSENMGPSLGTLAVAC